MIRWEQLGAAHFEEWGVEQFPHPSRMMGFACRRDEALVAIGLVWVDDAGKWWGNFEKRAGFPLTIHAKTLRLFDALRCAGVREVWADCNYAIPKAEEWLWRLMFRPVDEAKKVWRRELHIPGSRTQ